MGRRGRWWHSRCKFLHQHPWGQCEERLSFLTQQTIIRPLQYTWGILILRPLPYTSAILHSGRGE